MSGRGGTDLANPSYLPRNLSGDYMFDLDTLIEWLKSLPPIGVYAALWFTTYIENVFPPSPSDVVLLFIATLTGIGTIGFFPAVAVATLGSVMGFLTAFILGRQYGRKLMESEKLPFLTKKSREALTEGHLPGQTKAGADK